jgi:hypothetical protein
MNIILFGDLIICSRTMPVSLRGLCAWVDVSFLQRLLPSACFLVVEALGRCTQKTT